MQEQEKPSYLKGAAILAGASVFVKIIGAIYKIPLFQDGVLGVEGTADFQVTYSVYALLITISTAGIPAALSRLVSSAKAKSDGNLVRRYFSVAMPSFFLVGLAAMLFMFFGADLLAAAMNNSFAAPGIRVLAPAVFFVCIISVYRGYAQGFQNMIPTAISQIVEVLSKAVFGIAVALWFVSLGYAKHIVSAGAIVGVTIGLGLCIPLLFREKRKLDRQIGPGEAPAAPLSDRCGDAPAAPPPSKGIFAQIMKVSIPITLSASFMSIMTVVDNSIVLGRLQGALGMTETMARGDFGVYSRVLSVYNLVPSLLVPISVSIIPAIAAAIATSRKDEARTIMQSSVKIVNLIAMPAAAGLMILAMPVLTALYNDRTRLAETMMVIMGAASFFVCLQYVTTAILQANGYERVSLLTFPVGAAAKIMLVWFLAANPNIGIIASPIGTLVCFGSISFLNIVFIKVKIKDNTPAFLKVFAGPALCSAAMAGITFGIYLLLGRLVSGVLGNVRAEVIIILAGAIFIGVAAYAGLAIATGTVTMEDMKLIPKGERIGRLLKVKP